MKLKKIFLVFMTMLLIFCTVSLSAFAAEETTETISETTSSYVDKKGYYVKSGRYVFDEKLDFSMLADLIPGSYYIYFNLSAILSNGAFFNCSGVRIYIDVSNSVSFYIEASPGGGGVYYSNSGWVLDDSRYFTVIDDFYIDDLDMANWFSANTTYLDGEETNFSLYSFFTSLGSGLRSFLPSMASAGVNTIDVLFVRSDGGLTTVAIITIIGASLAAGLGVFTIIKRRMQKV